MKTLRVSFSQMSAYRQCPLKWKLSYVDRIESPKSSPALLTGTIFHEMLAARYAAFAADDAAGRERDRTVAARDASAVLAGYVERGELVDPERTDLLAWMYIGYDEHYESDADWEILGIELEVDVPMAPGIRFVGYIDLLVRDRRTGRIWIVDFKTGSGKDASGAAWARELDLEDQFGLYQAALTLPIRRRKGPITELLAEEVPFGTIYALIRTDRLKRAMTAEERFGRYKMFRETPALEAIWDDSVLVAKAIRRASSPTGVGTIYSSPDPAQCRWKCSFVDVHVMSRATGRDAAEVAVEGYGFVPRKPRARDGEAAA